ncbi:hypothetical protein [Amycolatopsis saalfeldensis]|uniref:4-amino-4-deoxy-L-arabinose transferase n=1 Tax=Amycolatopsis saalfeldensis TaxID=394193 RepID=A0A1H8Y5J8_9PSEU|nr:hypothetical protein [Amycolatopsis saalfeldensis]SEP47352.1 hypothetical protein SAMN04489732_111106 [Amycolatopsis saalfeldensis]
MTVTEAETLQEDSPTSRRTRRTPVVVVGAVLLVVFLAGSWAAWFFTIDDAFISFRYAANLAAGHGPVWNVTGPRVEGFTDFGWVMWAGLGAWLGVALPLFMKLTSLVFGLLTLLMLVNTAHRRGGIGGALVAGGAYVVFLPTYFHITSGLETAAFAAVLLRIVLLGLRVLDGERVRAYEPPALLLVLGMLRPEGVLAALPTVAVWLWRERRSRAAWSWTAGAVLVGGGYFVWRWHYYGQLLPNTFYVKFGNLASGRMWTEHTTWLLLPLLLLTFSLVIRRATRRAGALLVVTVLLTYVTYAVSGPSMDYLDRFADHAVPVLCLGTGLAAATLGGRWAATLTGLVAIVWSAVVGATAPDLGTIANYGPDLQRAHVAIGKGLAAADVPEQARTLAVSDAGAMPYYSGWHSIDFIGLNDPRISRGADPTQVVVQARPTVIVLTAGSPTPGSTSYGLDVAKATAGYQEVAAVQMRDAYYQTVWALPEWAGTVREHVQTAVATAAPLNDPGRYDETVGRWLDRLKRQLPGF